MPTVRFSQAVWLGVVCGPSWTSTSALGITMHECNAHATAIELGFMLNPEPWASACYG